MQITRRFTTAGQDPYAALLFAGLDMIGH